MTLDQTWVFFRVAEDGGFSAAARRLGIPTSSASRAVAGLEQQLGVRLLHRTTRRIGLTDAGQRFHTQLSRVFAELEEAKAAVREYQLAPRGHVRMTMPVEFGMRFMGRITAEFMLAHPHVTIETELSSRLVNLTDEGFDLAFRIGEFPDSSLVAKRLATITRQWYASPDYLDRHGSPQSPEDLAGHSCILFNASRENTVRLVRKQSRQDTVVKVTGRLAVNHLSMAVDAASAGLGLVLANRFLCEEAIATGSLVPVLPEYSSIDGGLYAMYPSRQHLSGAVRSLTDFVAARIGEHPWFNSGHDSAESGQT